MQAPGFKYVDAQILQQLSNMKPYTLLIFRKGQAYDSAETEKIIQSQHLPYLFTLREKGAVALSLPIMDNTDMLAIAVYTIANKEEVKKLVEKDPAVMAGVFSYELLFCMGMKADTLP